MNLVCLSQQIRIRKSLIHERVNTSLAAPTFTLDIIMYSILGYVLARC
jgi:hypothetical protein